MRHIRLFENFLSESNEQRGYIDYEYDIKTDTLKKVGSGVASEYNIGLELLTYYNKDVVKKAVEENGKLMFNESPYEDPEEIKDRLKAAIEKIKNSGK